MPNISTFTEVPTIMRIWRDDWLFWVVLWDGRIYAYQTELWIEHGDETNRTAEWHEVRTTAILRTYTLANQNAQPYATIPAWAMHDIATDEKHARAFCDLVCESMSDSDFRRLIRR